MVEKRSETPQLRLFVALDLPEELRRGIEAWGASALDDPALRRVPIEALHITLAFLGQRSAEEVELIAAAMRESAVAAPSFELLDPVARPPRGRPRLFALPVRSPRAESLQADLRERLVSAGLYAPEKRPFWPHLTVARVRPEGGGSRRPKSLAEAPKNLPAALEKRSFCRRLTLYRSELQPSGAHYVPLAQVELSADGRQ
jgi:2'-5' RNA ligase